MIPLTVFLAFLCLLLCHRQGLLYEYEEDCGHAYEKSEEVDEPHDHKDNDDGKENKEAEQAQEYHSCIRPVGSEQAFDAPDKSLEVGKADDAADKNAHSHKTGVSEESDKLQTFIIPVHKE